VPRRDETWFLAPPAAWSEGRIVLPPKESHHALRVLRLRRGHEVTVSDGVGSVARCVIEQTDGDRVIASVLERDLRPHARPSLVVFQGAAKRGKNDAVVERLAEIGVSEAWIYESRRSVVKWDSVKSERLAARWDAIAQAAAKQSRNPYVMKTAAPVAWTELVRRVRSESRAVVLWEEATMPLRDALGAPTERIALVVGPEGGLAVDEANELAAAGAALVSLGPNVLRTENAALVAAAAIGYHFGLLG
jgi:16S rRNA (uracil1498-N3)-methyltransferase